ncbi:MAG TPA: NUDIX hydrolase, partial [Acidimicrobiales bacterium]
MFKKLGEREIYKGARITVVSASFESPDGERFERDVVHHPGAVGIVPVVDEGTAVLLVRQFRAPVDRELLEIPAGLRDRADEPTIETARRELVEEVGMRAGRLERLCEFVNSPGFCDEVVQVFLATGLRDVPDDRQGIEERAMVVVRVPLE